MALKAKSLKTPALEHHFRLYRQMSGAHYHITYAQILESEMRLQLSNILQLFSIKISSKVSDEPISLKNYLNMFVENSVSKARIPI